MEDELDSDYRKWLDGIRAMEMVIERKGRHDLDVLAASGVDRKVVLRFLAVAASRDGDWTRIMRQRQAALKSLSGRMETLARETRDRVNDLLSTVQFWAYIAGGGGALGMELPSSMAEDPGIPFIISGMSVLARKMKDQAARFGKFLRAYGRTNDGVVLLLVRYRMFRPKMEHLNELARLLTDAFEVAGQSKSFSAEGLRKTYKRHGRRFIRLWLSFNAPSASSAADSMPPPSLTGHRNLGA